MTSQTRDVLVALIVFAYNLSLVAGTAYLVTVYEWSAWWFVLTIMLMSGSLKTKD
jgi:hypothetical protein